jgi:predicted nucleotidyltransferase
MHIDTLPALIDRLKAHPGVIGIVRYGGRRVDDPAPGGDFDLFVLLDDPPPPVESLHFYVGHIPVDMNLRTLADLDRATPLTPPPHARICEREYTEHVRPDCAGKRVIR